MKSSQCPATPNGLTCQGTSTALDRSTSERPGTLRKKRSRARDELLALARAREYWDRAIKYLKLARLASDADVQRRFIAIAEHYPPWRKRRNATPNAWTLSDGPGIPAPDSFFRAQDSQLCSRGAADRPPISPGYRSCCALAMRYGIGSLLRNASPQSLGKNHRGLAQVAVPPTNDLFQDWPRLLTPPTPRQMIVVRQMGREQGWLWKLGG